MNPVRRYGFHALAFLIVAIWGTTFVSTKVLMQHGLTPGGIFFVRFLMAYVCILPLARGRLWADSLRDEALMLALGVTGGSLYFLTENMALRYSYCSNVAIIVCATPLITGFLLSLFYREERPGWRRFLCSQGALAGMVLVVLNGHFVLRLSPLGDGLALCASILWALYSLTFRMVGGHYDLLFITRKTFFYGLLTALPIILWFQPVDVDVLRQAQPVVWANLVYLGVIASFGCFWGWNVAMKRLGVVRSTNYLYLNPVVTLVTSHLVLGEQITPLAVFGAVLVLGGLYAEGRLRRSEQVGWKGGRDQ
ncbi:MAG: DMT family transporter [Clostridium sp.]|nr:DMT family transporter [Clostridium sp.]